MDVGLNEGEGAPNAVEGDVGEAEVGRHVDEMLPVRVKLAIACGYNEMRAGRVSVIVAWPPSRGKGWVGGWD